MTLEEIQSANHDLKCSIDEALQLYYDKVRLVPDVDLIWDDVSTFISDVHIPNVSVSVKIEVK